MLDIFKSKPANIDIGELGQFKYYKDRIDEYWELTSPYIDELNCVNIDFCAIAGTSTGPNEQAVKTLYSFLQNPNTLWYFTDSDFISVAAQDFKDISSDSVSEFFYIKSLTIDNANSYEIGFHARNSDIFIELFVRSGCISNIEKDYGCCDV